MNVSNPLPPVVVPHPHVVLDAHGSPMVEGSRIPVRRLYVWHRERTALSTILKRYPQLGPARLFDALAFAYDNLELVLADLEREKVAVEHGRAGPVGPLLSRKQEAEARADAQLSLPFKD